MKLKKIWNENIENIEEKKHKQTKIYINVFVMFQWLLWMIPSKKSNCKAYSYCVLFFNYLSFCCFYFEMRVAIGIIGFFSLSLEQQQQLKVKQLHLWKFWTGVYLIFFIFIYTLVKKKVINADRPDYKPIGKRLCLGYKWSKIDGKMVNNWLKIDCQSTGYLF